MKSTGPFENPVPRAARDGAAIERAIKVAIDALEEIGLRRQCCVAVGGGFLDERSALAVGADAYWQNMSAANVT